VEGDKKAPVNPDPEAELGHEDWLDSDADADAEEGEGLSEVGPEGGDGGAGGKRKRKRERTPLERARDEKAREIYRGRLGANTVAGVADKKLKTRWGDSPLRMVRYQITRFCIQASCITGGEGL
jgi:hypothetical protein